MKLNISCVNLSHTMVYHVYYISIRIILGIPLLLYVGEYNKYTVDTLMVSTMKITDETKKELVRIGAEYSLKDGKERTLEEVVKLLIGEHKHR
jgi:hypothetical protein